jgi:hypothetical protein
LSSSSSSSSHGVVVACAEEVVCVDEVAVGREDEDEDVVGANVTVPAGGQPCTNNEADGLPTERAVDPDGPSDEGAAAFGQY